MTGFIPHPLPFTLRLSSWRFDMDEIISLLQQLPPLGVLGLIFLIAYVENIFPPSPSDVLLVFGGTLVGVGTVGFFPAWLAATLGGTLGFLTAYLAGRYFERRVIEGRFSRYLPMAAITRVEQWFQRFGYGVIVANRFLAGTRAVVSFFAGMSRMHLPLTTMLCAVSAGVWNFLLLYLGMSFGSNWRSVGNYLALYSKAVTIALGVAAAVGLFWWYLKRRRNAVRSASAD
jgi:membrane protein DedA with SNARE-associated domain